MMLMRATQRYGHYTSDALNSAFVISDGPALGMGCASVFLDRLASPRLSLLCLSWAKICVASSHNLGS